MDDLINDFIAQASEDIEKVGNELIDLEKDPSKAALIDDIFRVLHSIKGTCGFFGLTKLALVANAGENLMSKVRSKQLIIDHNLISIILEIMDKIKEIIIYIGKNGKESDVDYTQLIKKTTDISSSLVAPSAPSSVPNPPIQPSKPQAEIDVSVRVSLDTLDKLTQTITELMSNRNELLKQKASEIDTPLYKLNAITTHLQDEIIETRLQSISHAWLNVPRLVRDLSSSLNKQINLNMQGGSTRLDRQLIEAIQDPIVHMIRNSADHGIEMPADRVKLGKPEAGTITLNAYHNNGQVIIEVSDDGAGMNIEQIKAKIIEKKLASEQEIANMNENQIIQYIFTPGFSTSETVSNISGRGVGMNVVKENIEELSGTVEIKSIEGKGSSIILSLPLTLALMQVLLVKSAGQCFAISQININRIIALGNSAKEVFIGKQLLPCVNLAEKLGLVSKAAVKFAVVINVKEQIYGLIVDSVEAVEDIVLRPMAKLLRKTGLYTGNSIIGDDQVILLLNVNNLAQELITLQPQELGLDLKRFLLFEIANDARAIAFEQVITVKDPHLVDKKFAIIVKIDQQLKTILADNVMGIVNAENIEEDSIMLEDKRVKLWRYSDGA